MKMNKIQLFKKANNQLKVKKIYAKIINKIWMKIFK